MQTTLDLSIKKHETGTLEGGYTTKKEYPSYMNNQMWDSFKKDMEQNHKAAYTEYGAGSGGEMNPKGKFPPKMASYGSSSRMIYNLCKDIPNFHFEYQLPTRVGGIANLDGFMDFENKYTFVEAKCREPYGVKPHLIEKKYKDLYNYINKNTSCNINIKVQDEESKIKVDFFADDLAVTYFDIKQMICHLLGIAVKFLNNPTDKKICFLYLCYNPKLIEITDTKKKDEIYKAYDKMCDECNSIDFVSLFETVIRYLHEELNVGKATNENITEITSRFTFTLCDQNNFMHYLK